MAGMRRGNIRARLDKLEQLAGKAHDPTRPRTVIYLPCKDGDNQSAGVYPSSPGVLLVLYEVGRPMPTLPEGW